MLPSEEWKNQKHRWGVVGESARLLAFPLYGSRMASQNPQSPCLGLFPVDASGFLLGKFSESSAGSLSPLGHGPCDQPDLARFAGVCWELLGVFYFRQIVLCSVSVARIAAGEHCGSQGEL